MKLFSKDMLSYTELAPSSKSGSSLSYGPYKDVGAFAAHELRVHFENNSPFAEVTALTREVEVSHWGNVYVEETYTLRHGGARLKVRAIPSMPHGKQSWLQLRVSCSPTHHVGLW